MSLGDSDNIDGKIIRLGRQVPSLELLVLHEQLLFLANEKMDSETFTV